MSSTTSVNVSIHPYLFFSGRCEEAIEFYQTALGASVKMLMRFSESPDPMPEGMLPPGFERKVMHAEIAIGDTSILMSDGCETGGKSEGFSLALNLKEEADADRYFKALADGGEVTMPLDKTFWSPRFGMLKDRFGVAWMVHVIGEAA